MLGAPDALGDLLDALDTLGTVFEDIFGPVLNPITAPLDELKQFIKDKLKEAIEEAPGVDFDQLKSFLTQPEPLARGRLLHPDAPVRRHA